MIFLTRDGYRVIIDEIDADLTTFKWYRMSKGYIYRALPRAVGRNKKSYLHREIGARVYGELGDLEVDHFNRDPSDNRRENLRHVTNAVNCWNTSRVDRARGAAFHKQSGLWRALIRFHGKTIMLGLFKTADEAGTVYRAARARRAAGLKP